MIAQKRAPALITTRFAAWLPSHVLAHGARRDSNAELDQQFVRDPLLAPWQIVARHFSDQAPQFQQESEGAPVLISSATEVETRLDASESTS